ncbi:flagellin, partial [Enterobacter roggenkampii]
AEVNQRMEEVNRVTTQTDFNGIKVLNTGSGTSSYSFQVGSKDSETISIGLSSSNAFNLYNATGATFTTTGQTINGNARTTAAEGFDVLSGTVNATGGVDGGPLADIDAAIKSVDNQRSLLGASQNRFESTITNLNNTVNNLSAARSRIQDSDYATEVSNMSRAQILQQAGSSVLAQANQVPQTMLSLLR